MNIQFSNFAASTIANSGGISAGATSLSAQSGEGALFPAITGSQYFYIVGVKVTGEREIMKVTARTNDLFTIVRAQEGTIALAFAENDIFVHRMTAKSLSDLLSEALSNDLESTTVAFFGQNAAPTGWTRKSDWTSNSMLLYLASGNIGSGGAVNAAAAHVHAGPAHSHSLSAHVHAGPYHAHSTAPHTLVINEMPYHGHAVPIAPSYRTCAGGSSDAPNTWFGGVTYTTSGGAGGGAPHSHGNTGGGGNGNTGGPSTDSTGSAGNGNTGMNSAPYYVQVIGATKD